MRASARPSFFTGRPREGREIKDLTWLKDDGGEIDADYFQDSGKHFIAWQLDAAATDAASRIYVAYNGWVEPITAALPALPEGQSWFLAIDTADPDQSFDTTQTPVSGSSLTVGGRAVVAAVAKPAG